MSMKCEVCDKPLVLSDPKYVHADGKTYRHPIHPVPMTGSDRGEHPGSDDDWCWHESDELHGDEHRANCLLDPDAAARLAGNEGRWDAQGISQFGRGER